MSIRKASVLELATHAYELDAGVLRGVLEKNQEGSWTIGGIVIDEWLAPYTGQSMVVIAASLEDERPMKTKVCRTCGREYQGTECPHCRRVRRRLRGW
jgi:hypothetical protein